MMTRRVRPGHGPMPGGKAKDFKGTIKKLQAYFKKYKLGIICALVCAGLGTAFMVFGPKILGTAITTLFDGVLGIITGEGSIDFTAIGRILGFLAALYVVSSLLTYVQGFIMSGIATKVSYSLRKDISGKIDRLPVSFFDKVPQGEVLSLITNDVDMVTQTLNQGLSQTVTLITQLIGAVIMMITISIPMTLVVFCIFPFSMIIVRSVVKISQKYFRNQQNFLGKVNGHIEEMYGAHLVVTAFNGQEESLNTFNEYNDKLYESGWKSQFLSGIMMPLVNLVANLGYVIICVLGGFLTIKGAVAIGDIQALIQYLRNFTQPINQLANVLNQFQMTVAAAERVFNFLDQDEETKDVENPVSPEEIDGSVSFDHIHFGYVPEKTVIKDFSQEIKPGTKVAIVGPTGAGKTTIVKLLMRFYDVNEGAIKLNGHDIRNFSRDEMRKSFGMVLQDTWLYNDTIRENIRFSKLDASDEEVIEAAKAAQADHFIRTLSDGYDTILGEDGGNISQGQRQLLTIARSILADSKILILDEATSSVDTRTEISIQKAMDALTKDRTSFIIAHRLSTIKNADIILVIKDGDIVETGNHEELLEKGGFYASLYKSQFEHVQ